MKNLRFFLYVLLVFFANKTFAQQFPLDSATHKISYSDIVIVDSLTAPQLYKNAEKWMNSYYKEHGNYSTQFNLVEGFIGFKASYLVYTSGIMSKQVHGRISYSIKLDIKQNKYRYTFTDFVFEYYKQNRQLEYVPSGRCKPLEDKKYLGSQTVWNKHRINSSLLISKQIEQLKKSMIIKDEIATKKEEKVIKKADW